MLRPLSLDKIEIRWRLTFAWQNESVISDFNSNVKLL